MMWTTLKDDYLLIKIRGDDLTSVDGCLIYRVSECSVTIIEDDALARQIMENMKTAGVPVQKEQPNRVNPVTERLNAMLDEGKSREDIKAMLDEARRHSDEKRRREQLEYQRFIQGE